MSIQPLGEAMHMDGYIFQLVSLEDHSISSMSKHFDYSFSITDIFHRTREKYLPLLTSPAWWSETMFELRKEFKKDPGFNETMFQKQMSVVKGQGWNLVQSLIGEEGPLELCRRGSKLVKDQYHWVDEQFSTNPVPLISPSISSPPVTHSFPPEIPIPIPFKKKQSTSIKSSNSEVEVYGSLTGVSILAQMDEEEKAARRSFGNARKIEEEEEAENENVESSGRIVEESNKVVDGDSNWKDKIRDTLSFDVERIPVLKRARSSGSFSIRRGHSRNTSRADEAWLHEIEGKKLVVFESLESIEVKPFFRDW